MTREFQIHLHELPKGRQVAEVQNASLTVFRRIAKQFVVFRRIDVPQKQNGRAPFKARPL
jgi:hypothetical protein